MLKIARMVADFIDHEEFFVRLAFAFLAILIGFGVLCLMMALMFNVG